MSVYAIAICDICRKEKRSPVNHASDAAYWTQAGGERPRGWRYYQAHHGDSAASILFCDECEGKLADRENEQVQQMIREAAL